MKILLEPVTPEEIEEGINVFPDFVIEAFNYCIIVNYNKKYSFKIYQSDVIDRILRKNKKIKKEDIFNNKWLDVEILYRSKGWEVDYHKPPYYENWPSYFLFKKKDI
jgi:hypothetical protein